MKTILRVSLCMTALEDSSSEVPSWVWHAFCMSMCWDKQASLCFMNVNLLYYLFSMILFRSCSFHCWQTKQSNEKQNKGTLFFVVSNQQNFVANETKRFQLRPKHKTEQNRNWKLFKRKWNHFCLSWMDSKKFEIVEHCFSKLES